ncbi:hypothetical protein B0H17DRAFT_1133133 [Mycena rosella]|uniref:Uncharacterized protein n=1 Tax=Mycena rosella TaxID=1033263 RepID=A0AAD7DIH2_MYCRO|nr:hypothetical protein B0H17DRAFT_1133133 [Mycena rosella]
MSRKGRMMGAEASLRPSVAGTPTDRELPVRRQAEAASKAPSRIMGSSEGSAAASCQRRSCEQRGVVPGSRTAIWLCSVNGGATASVRWVVTQRVWVAGSELRTSHQCKATAAYRRFRYIPEGAIIGQGWLHWVVVLVINNFDSTVVVLRPVKPHWVNHWQVSHTEKGYLAMREGASKAVAKEIGLHIPMAQAQVERALLPNVLNPHPTKCRSTFCTGHEKMRTRMAQARVERALLLNGPLLRTWSAGAHSTLDLVSYDINPSRGDRERPRLESNEPLLLSAEPANISTYGVQYYPITECRLHSNEPLLLNPARFPYGVQASSTPLAVSKPIYGLQPRSKIELVDKTRRGDLHMAQDQAERAPPT